MSERRKSVGGRASSGSRSRSRNGRGSSDHGKAMHKPKSKSKLKHKDLNRRGAEKEGTDMDAFVNLAAAAASKQEAKTQQQSQKENKVQSVQPQISGKDGNVDALTTKESAKGVKERENNETKIESVEPEVTKLPKSKISSKSEATKETSVVLPSSNVSVPVKETIVDDLSEPQTIPTIQQNHKDVVTKESTPTIEESNSSPTVLSSKTLPNDVVDHSTTIVKDEIDVETIVAQKNEENTKVSALHASTNDNKASNDDNIVEKEKEDAASSETEAPKGPPALKYTYKDDQWSPRNVMGKKEYDRDFLMRLQDDPKSKVRPQNLPDMEVVLNQCIMNRSTEFRPFRDSNPDRHGGLLPAFAKSSFNNAKMQPLLTKKSYQGKAKSTKPNQIHVSLSLREDVKLRETENAWRPARLKPASAEEDAKRDDLYKKVRSVLNKLTPQKFDTLVSQVRALEIDTQEKLQGVIDLVFEKAVDEPNFSVAYALMCKELALMKVLTDEAKLAQENNEVPENTTQNPNQSRPGEVNFRKLIVERCQMQFQKNTNDEAARIVKQKEVEECTDPEKKKELQATLDEDERKLRIRSVGNIRFIGELFKKEMLSRKIMTACVHHLLSNPDEENLECLCKLLTTIGKVLEDPSGRSGKADNLDPYFVQLTELASKKNKRKITSRIRFMIQDVLDLRQQNWVPRRDENKPKTMDQILKEAEYDRSAEIQLNNTPINTPRKYDRNNDRRRARGGGSSGMEEGGWSQPAGKTRQPYSVETSKLSTKAPSPDEMRLGNRSTYAWFVPPSSAPSETLTPNKFAVLDSDMDKRPLQVSGSRSTGPRDYGRQSNDFKAPWENKGPSRMGSHQMSSGSLMESGRSQSVSMPPPQMKMKPQPTFTASTGSMSSLSSSTSSNKPRKSQDELIRIVNSMIDEAPCEPNTELFIKNAMESIQDHFDSSSYGIFVREAINGVLERTAAVRHHFSSLFSHLLNNNIIQLSLFQTEFTKLLEIADDLVIDIPKVWTYLAEILSNMVVTNAHPLSEMKTTAAILKSNGTGAKLMGELLSNLARDQGPKWVAEKWDQSRLQWSDFTDKVDNVDDIIKQYKLEFLNGECKSSDIASSGSQLTNDQIHDHLVKLMRESDFDNICSWILANVGSRVTDPQFIRVLMTAILDVTVEERHKVWKLNEKSFKNQQTLIKRFIDANADLELQCLFAIQAYVHKLEHPHGLLFAILTSLHQNDILSDEAFLTWESHTGEFPGHAVAIKGLTSFFTGLREPDSDDA